MQEEVRTAIAKAMEDEPEGPDKGLLDDGDLAQTRSRGSTAMTKFKPKPVTVTLVRECCGKKFVHVLSEQEEGEVV